MREKIGFWILGLCNNFGYVIMLSSAMDILNPSHFDGEEFKPIAPQDNVSITDSNPRDCNPISTGAVLLADIIPTVIIKLLAPFLSVGIHFRISSILILNITSLILVALAHSSEWTFTGIVCASLASGLGEVSFLSSMTRLQQDVVSSWSSGTGAAGIAGATAYASLTGMGISSRATLLSMLVVPLIMALTFWGAVYPIMSPERHESSTGYESLGLFDVNEEPDDNFELDQANEEEEEEDNLRFHIPRSPEGHEMNFKIRLFLIPGLIKYMAPIGIVYFFEYLINQGLFELLYFPKFINVLNHHEQYRWYQVVYQVGVFVSRSSLICFSFHRIWILSVFQIINFLVLLPQAIYWFFPSYWIVFCLVFWEGLLGGCVYVNTYANIRRNILNTPQQEFALGFTCLADSVGIALSGLLALPLHKAVCNMPLPKISVQPH
eukprot:TRINITY_DN7268_c0_g1_i1.p1 TRINITY_DN7268_c0_g1~~TRINITY_DN7268_c0_g1_i1.p1  ORF type:complete len:436 (+),score=7.35 TRINITY_DN7268_c0_g1_i1:39-1346(+)